MSVPEASDPAFDTLMLDPVVSVPAVMTHPDSLSVITTDPAGVRTERSLASLREPAATATPATLDLRKRFTELDGLRGAAALFVVVFHLRKHIDDLGVPEPVYLLISGGYLMVDLFFVLSGFVLARMMLATRTPRDVVRFSAMRARRFLPLHLTGVGIVFGCVLVTWLVQHYGYQHAPNRAAFSSDKETPWAYLSAVLLLQGFVGPQFAGYAAAWSLSIELWTNILIVLAIAVVPWLGGKKLVGPVATVTGTLILFTVTPDAENSIGWTAFGRGLTGLGIGMTVYWAYSVRHYRPARWPAIGAALGLAGLVICMYYSRDLRDLQFMPAFIISAGLIFCLVQQSHSPAHRLLNSPVVQWLGSRSFALYALHGPTLIAVTLACRLRGLTIHNPKVSVLIVVATLVGALSAAEIGHRFIERLWVPKKSE